MLLKSEAYLNNLGTAEQVRVLRNRRDHLETHHGYCADCEIIGGYCGSCDGSHWSIKCAYWDKDTECKAQQGWEGNNCKGCSKCSS